MNKLLPFLFLLVIIGSCRSDEPCPDGIGYYRNPNLDFLPYEIDDEVFFIDSLGNRDTLKITAFSTNLYYQGSVSCVNSDGFSFDFMLNYNSAKVCEFGISSSEPRFFFIGGCSFSATNFDNIERIENYEFEGVNYSVYEINHQDGNSEFEKIVIAKDVGFLFFKINGITRKAI